jgi:methionine synthase II (cobalamin-independent)
VKVQAPGPVTLAAHLELAGGHRALTDSGAVRDLTVSLAEGVAQHRARLALRLGSPVVVQFDEPSLPAALAGRLTGVTSLNPVHPVDESVVTTLLDECVETVGGEVALHVCAADLPWKLLQRSTISALSVDANTLTAADLDGVGEFVDSGRTVLFGVVPTTVSGAPPSAEQLAAAVAGVTDRLGFSRSVLRDRVGVTPVCGLAGATPEWARSAVELAQRASDRLTEDPAEI